MTNPLRPNVRPSDPNFSAGPTTKRPGWSLDCLKDATFGRSHRSKPGVGKLTEVLKRTHSILGLPDDYRVGIMPGSDTGAIEAAMWCLLGPRKVDVLAWEAFGKDWITDVLKELKLDDARAMEADFGQLPDLSQIDFSRDVIFTWNGTTSGVRVPESGDWIPDNREGLTLCDATSAVFGMNMPWQKLDVVTYSWQKVMGGEAQHGIIILSPRAVERLENHTPAWPVPKLFRMAANSKLNEGIFNGKVINTPSMLAVEDALDGLRWGESIGGYSALVARTSANFEALRAWVEKTPWIKLLCQDPDLYSTTSGCLVFADPEIASLGVDAQRDFAGKMVALLDDLGIAYDINAYPKAPPGLRVWCGATVETSNIEALLPWLDWAFETVKGELATAA